MIEISKRVARRFIPTERQVIVTCSRLVIAGLLLAGAKYVPGRAGEWIATIGHFAIVLASYGLIMGVLTVFEDHVVTVVDRLQERWIVWRTYNPRGSTWDEMHLDDALEAHRQRKKINHG